MSKATVQVRCDDCGRFIARADTAAQHHFTPLNEFGPEQVDWVCGKCAAKSGLTDSNFAETANG